MYTMSISSLYLQIVLLMGYIKNNDNNNNTNNLYSNQSYILFEHHNITNTVNLYTTHLFNA